LSSPFCITLKQTKQMTTIELAGKTYKLDWTFLSQEYMEQSADILKQLKSNIGRAAVMAVAALMGGDYNFDKSPDWVLNAIGKDAKKMNELSEKVSAEFNAFIEANKEPEVGNSEAAEEDQKAAQKESH